MQWNYSTNVENDNDEWTIQFYIKRKKNSKIPDEFKVKLALDAKRNSFTISEIWRKYFIGESTARNILKEVADFHSFQFKIVKQG